jgi:hypothetical protein
MKDVNPPARLDYETLLTLAKELGRPVPQLLALNRNHDPYFAGVAFRRKRAEWFAGFWGRFAFPAGVHLRRIHYRWVSDKPPPETPGGETYRNTEECWALLVEASKDARHLGLVNADAFEDHRNPEPVLFEGGDPSAFYRDTPGWGLEEFPDWRLPEIPEELWVWPFRLPETVVSGYDCDGRDQPYHLECWIEKSTMNDVLTPVCRRLGINLITGVGFLSITGVVNMLRRAARLPAGKAARIFYISDFDPAGTRMPVAVARQAEFYLQRYAPGREVKLTPLALTRDQVIRYELPRIPIKESDRRRAGFEDRHGEGATELDALEALHPGELARLLEGAAARYRDPTLARRMAEAKAEAEAEARNAWREATTPLRRALSGLQAEAQQIARRYEDALKELSGRLREELAPVREQLERVRQAAHAEEEALEVALPDRPEAEADPGDEGNWLFDSGRDYLEQLAHYPPPTARSNPRPRPGGAAPGGPGGG